MDNPILNSLPNYPIHDPDPQFPQRVLPSTDQVGAYQFVGRTPCPCGCVCTVPFFVRGSGWSWVGEEVGHEGSAVRSALR
jgi:hypothetical protein